MENMLLLREIRLKLFKVGEFRLNSEREEEGEEEPRFCKRKSCMSLAARWQKSELRPGVGCFRTRIPGLITTRGTGYLFSFLLKCDDGQGQNEGQ